MNNKSHAARMALNCAADSMETLRKCDVERVVETAQRNGSFFEVIAWIANERQDLKPVLNLVINQLKQEKL